MPLCTQFEFFDSFDIILVYRMILSHGYDQVFIMEPLIRVKNIVDQKVRER